MPISDKNIQWKRKKLFVGQREMCREHLGDEATNMRSVAAGNPLEVEIAALGVSGLRMDNAGEEASFLVMLPYDIDPRSEIGVTVHWTTKSSEADDTLTWKVSYNALKANAVVTAVGSASALDTTIEADNVVAQYGWHKTSRGVINADTLSILSDDPEQVGLQFFVELDGVSGITIATEYGILIGVELDYYPAMTDNTLARHAKRVNVA